MLGGIEIASCLRMGWRLVLPAAVADPVAAEVLDVGLETVVDYLVWDRLRLLDVKKSMMMLMAISASRSAGWWTGGRGSGKDEAGARPVSESSSL